MNIRNNVYELIGNTPLLELHKLEKKYDLQARLLAKVEYFNVTGSIKDRAALEMIEDAEEKGLLNKDSVIIEPTSGNTGIGLASVGTAKGYRVIIVMPDTFSIERRKLIKAYGAEIVLSDGKLGMKGAIEKAEQLHKEMDNSIIAGQFVNPANWKAHYKTTGPEIYNDTDGNVDIFVSAVGTGGTITGTARYLKEKKDIKVICVEPDASPVLSGGKAGPHKIQGIGAGFIPEILDVNLIDEVIRVKDEDAINTAIDLGISEGILCGISSGAALWAAITEAKKEINKDKTIVVVLPDSADRYMSTELFGD